MRQRLLVCLGAVFLYLVYPAPGFSMQENADDRAGTPDERVSAKAVLAKHEAALMRMPGVIGVGIGLTEAGDHVAIHVFMNARHHDASDTSPIPPYIDRVPVRIITDGIIKAR